MSQLDLQAQQAASVWHNNPMLVQLLGLSPLLALSDRSSTALALGVGTFLVGLCAALSGFGLRRYLSGHWRYPVYCLILAFYTSLLALLLEAFFYPLWREMGVYLPLIACNLGLLLRFETYASADDWLWVGRDSSKFCAGMVAALLGFAMLRELLVSGTLFSDWALLMPASESLQPQARQQAGELFRFASLQPAAFILLGLVIAALRYTGLLREPPLENNSAEPVARARVTGRLKRKT